MSIDRTEPDGEQPTLEVYGELPPRFVYFEDEPFGATITQLFHQQTQAGAAVFSELDPKLTEVFVADVRMYLVDIVVRNTHAGLDVIRELAKQKRAGRSIVIIGISVHGDLKQQAIAAGADMFIEKRGADAVLKTLKEQYRRIIDVPEPQAAGFAYRYPGIVVDVGSEEAVVELQIEDQAVKRAFPVSQLEYVKAAFTGCHILYCVNMHGNKVSGRIELLDAEEDAGWKRPYYDQLAGGFGI